MHGTHRVPQQASWIHGLYRFPPLLFGVRSAICRVQLFFLQFYKNREDVDFLRSIYRSHRCLIQPTEAYTLLQVARMQSSLEGDMAEVGVYEGASAAIICHAKGRRHFFGFDTFEGLPADGEERQYGNATFFRKGMFSADREKAEQSLRPFQGVTLVEGRFPQSAVALGALNGRKFSLVHLDADLEQSTRDGLQFFWERMTEGGIIIVHDSNAQGVAKVLREFMERVRPRHCDLYATQTVIFK